MEFRHELVRPNDDLPFRMVVFEGRDGNYTVPKHWHKSIELFLVLEGEVKFDINSTVYALHKGQFIIVNSNDVHSIDCIDQNFIIVLQIPRSIFDDYIKGEYIIFESTRYEKDSEIIGLIEHMYHTYEQKEYGYYYSVLGDFYKMLFQLICKYKIEDVDGSYMKRNHNLERLSAITNYIEQNFREELTLESVAQQFGFTPTYLSKIFQKYASINYKSFLVNVRLNAAYKQLLNTGDSIATIAMHNGFSDSRSFSKAFAKRYGVQPNTYRKNRTSVCKNL